MKTHKALTALVILGYMLPGMSPAAADDTSKAEGPVGGSATFTNRPNESNMNEVTDPEATADGPADGLDLAIGGEPQQNLERDMETADESWQEKDDY